MHSCVNGETELLIVRCQYNNSDKITHFDKKKEWVSLKTFRKNFPSALCDAQIVVPWNLSRIFVTQLLPKNFFFPLHISMPLMLAPDAKAKVELLSLFLPNLLV